MSSRGFQACERFTRWPVNRPVAGLGCQPVNRLNMTVSPNANVDPGLIISPRPNSTVTRLIPVNTVQPFPSNQSHGAFLRRPSLPPGSCPTEAWTITEE